MRYRNSTMAPVPIFENVPPPQTNVEAQKYDILEDYKGAYRFAPIQEAQVSRAMIKRSAYWAAWVIRGNAEVRKGTSIPCTRGQFPTSSSSELGVLVYHAHTASQATVQT